MSNKTWARLTVCKTKNPDAPKIGDYCLFSRWSDADMNDPWCVGYLDGIEVHNGIPYYSPKDKTRSYKHCVKITAQQGRDRIAASNRDFSHWLQRNLGG